MILSAVDAAKDEPSNTIVTVLIGAVVAGILAAIVRMLLDYRAERRELRAAVRVMVEDLARLAHRLRELDLGQNAGGTKDRWLRLDGWPDVRLALARGLKPKEWEVVRATVAHVELMHRGAAGIGPSQPDQPMLILQDNKHRELSLKAAEEAMEMLRKRAKLHDTTSIEQDPAEYLRSPR